MAASSGAAHAPPAEGPGRNDVAGSSPPSAAATNPRSDWVLCPALLPETLPSEVRACAPRNPCGGTALRSLIASLPSSVWGARTIAACSGREYWHGTRLDAPPLRPPDLCAAAQVHALLCMARYGIVWQPALTLFPGEHGLLFQLPHAVSESLPASPPPSLEPPPSPTPLHSLASAALVASAAGPGFDACVAALPGLPWPFGPRRASLPGQEAPDLQAALDVASATELSEDAVTARMEARRSRCPALRRTCAHTDVRDPSGRTLSSFVKCCLRMRAQRLHLRPT